MNHLVSVSLVTLASAVLTPVVKADEGNRKTVVTFRAPVEVPGVHLAGWGVLPAGAYVFKILDSPSDRRVVQVFSRVEKAIYATILAVPNYRLKAADKTVTRCRERLAGEPEALCACFYPGRSWGEDFVGPTAKALVLAKTTNTPVLSTEAELPVEVDAPRLLPDAPVIIQMKQASVRTFRPTGETVPLAEA